MKRKWSSATELADALRARAGEGLTTVVSPETAKLIAFLIDPPRRPPDRFHIDAYAQGSAIYKLDAKGEIDEVVAFAKSTLTARAAFLELCESNPRYSFSQRRKSWVEDERIVREEDIG
jgi:hypothetical protein